MNGLITTITGATSRKGLWSFERATVTFACMTMYAMASVHFGLSISWIFLSNDNSVAAQNEVMNCLSNLEEGHSCALQSYMNNVTGTSSDPSLEPGTDCIPSILLTISVSTTLPCQKCHEPHRS